jgi:hypothetical protein
VVTERQLVSVSARCLVRGCSEAPADFGRTPLPIWPGCPPDTSVQELRRWQPRERRLDAADNPQRARAGNLTTPHLSASAREDALNVFGLLDLWQLTEFFEWRENPNEAG